MRPRQEAFEVCAPGVNERVHLSVLSTVPTSVKVRVVGTVSQYKDGDTAPTQQRIAAWNDGGMHVLGHTGSTQAAMLRVSLQLTPE